MFKSVTLEMSLKPFKKTEDSYIRKVCEGVFEQWHPLLKNREVISIMLWTADGSEILDYTGDLNQEFEWCYFVGTANLPLLEDMPAETSLHQRKQLYMDNPPKMIWFPFGHGLSYTMFEYSDLVISKRCILADQFDLEVSCKIKNAGTLEGKEVVQLYISPLDSVVSRPLKELRAFDKICLAPGETKEVTFKLTDMDFAYFNLCELDWHVESGSYEILVGTSSADILLRDTVRISYDGDYTKE